MKSRRISKEELSVPFGSAAHGMMLRAMEKTGLLPDLRTGASQSPEIAEPHEESASQKRRFRPVRRIAPFRGFARKIYDGARPSPSFTALSVRKDFAEKYPEIVVVVHEALRKRRLGVKPQARSREGRGVAPKK